MKARVQEELGRHAAREAQRAARLACWANGEQPGPFQVTYFPTNACNLKCTICWQRLGVPDYSELPLERQLRLVEEAAALEAREFVVGGGGEPFIRWPALRRLLEQIKSRGLYGLLFTNGTLISADVARSLVRMGWDKILLSLDGTREVNDRLRDRGCYDRVLRALDRLTAARSDRRLPLIGVGCVLTAPGLDEIPRLIRILGERGCDQLNLIRLVVNLPEQRVFALTEEHLARLRPVLLEALAAAEALGMATNFSQYLDAELVGQVERFQGVLLGPRTLAQPGATFWNALCFEPFANIVIQSTGAAGPCCMSGERPLASITNRTLEDVWYGREFTGLRQAILRRQPEPYCRICDLNVFEENQRLRHARGGL